MVSGELVQIGGATGWVVQRLTEQISGFLKCPQTLKAFGPEQKLYSGAVATDASLACMETMLTFSKNTF